MKIKISDLMTFREDCERKYYYNQLKFEKPKDPFFNFTLTMLDYMRNCVAYGSLNEAEHFIDKNIAHVPDDWFVLKKEGEQLKSNLKNLLMRYLTFEFSRDKAIIERNHIVNTTKIVNGEGITFTGMVDLILKHSDDQYEAVKYKLGAPELSSAARKEENKPESSIELALYYDSLKDKYPGIVISYYHLKHKDDKGYELKPVFNDKKNKNIVTAVFNETIANQTLDKLEEINYSLIGATSNKNNFSQNKKSCTFCDYEFLCQNSKNIKMTPAEIKRKKEFKPNYKQKEVIETIDNAIRVIAPAGSGKTGTLVARYANMISKGISPKNVLLLSFSNKAVDELKERIVETTGLDTGCLEIYTYNSFCFNVVKQFQRFLDVSGNLKLISKKDRYDYITKFLNNCGNYDLNLSYINPFGTYGVVPKVDKLSSLIIEKDWLKKDIDELSSFLSIDDISLVELYRDCAVYIKQNMIENNLINYSDQIKLTKQLLKEYPQIAESLALKYRYIIVDEYQDTDALQGEVLYAIAKHHNNICVVGDDDQSIYEFRGATVNNILKFHEMFPGCKDIILTDNYRSAQPIVELSAELIANNSYRIDKKIKAINGACENPIIYKNITELNEIINHIKEILKHYSLNDITIISRKNSTLKKMEELLWESGIPAKQKSTSLRDNKDFKNIISFLNVMLSDSYENIDPIFLFYYMENVLGLNTEKINDSSFKNSLTNMTEYHRLLIQMEEWFCLFIHENFEYSRKKMYDYLQVSENVVNCFEKLIIEEDIKDMEQLYKYLVTIEVYKEEITVDDDTVYDAVNLLTAHASKGLEFPVVFIPDINEFIPDSDGDEEERRVLYVSMTRAKDILYIFEKESKKKSIYADEITGSMFEVLEAV